MVSTLYYRGVFFLSQFYKLSFGENILNFKIPPRQSIELFLLFHLKQEKLKSIENCQRSSKNGSTLYKHGKFCLSHL